MNAVVFSLKFQLCLVLLSSMLFLPLHAEASVKNNGGCSAEHAETTGEEYFTILGTPDLFLGAGDTTKIDAEAISSIDMHTSVYVLEKGEDVSLIKTTKNLLNGEPICGGVATRDILPRNTNSADARKVANTIEWENPKTGKLEILQNNTPHKIILKSNPSDESDATKVSLYDKPDESSRIRTGATVFGVFYYYDERIDENGEDWYWIAGETPRQPTEFSGWIPGKHALFWESQISIYYNDEDTDANIYATPESAENFDSEQILAAKPSDYVERSSGPDVVSDENIARFPVLNEEPLMEESKIGGKSLYRVGFFADSDQVQDSSVRAKNQGLIKNVDMVFLLDNTLSMTKYFPYVVEGVQNSTSLINNYNADQGLDIEVRYGAALYGDYLSDEALPGDIQFEVIADFSYAGYAKHFNRLVDIAEGNDYFEDELNDRPEAGLAGIVEAINQMQWSDSSQFRVLVWIGDHGSREVGNSETVDIEQVIDAVNANNVMVLPINVSGQFDAKWNKEFVRQGDIIAGTRGVGDSPLATRIAYESDGTEDFNNTLSFIEEVVIGTYTTSVVVSESVQTGGTITETISRRQDLLDLIPAGKTDVVAMSSVLCEMVFGESGCQTVRTKGQFMTEGFVTFDEQQRNFDFWINLTYPQLEGLALALRSLCKGFEQNNIVTNLESAMVGIQTTFGGDAYRSDIPIGKYLRRHIFLPAEHFPSILESTPDDINELWELARDLDTRNNTTDETQRIARPVCKSAALLSLALQNKRLIDPANDLVLNEARNSINSYSWKPIGNDRVLDFNWDWAQGGNNSYYYLPVNFFPENVE